MTQKRFVSMIGALVVILGAVAFITGCPQANSNKGNTGNNGGSLEVQPTGKADSALKGTRWENNASAPIKFAENGNIANMSGDQALYTIKGEMISFDLSSSIANFKQATEEKVIQGMKIETQEDIAELEKEIREAEKSGDEQTKTQLEAKLAKMKEILQMLENPDEQMKEEIKGNLELKLMFARVMEQCVKFEGIFNEDKSKLTIKQFPDDWTTGTPMLKEIVFVKNK